MDKVFLKIKKLKTYFPVYEGLIFKRIKSIVKAVDNVTLELQRGDVLGLVGESGCGKSTLGRSIMQLEKITSGYIEFDGHVLNDLSGRKLKKMRPKFQMIFQDPYSSLNPRMTVFDTLTEPLAFHGRAKKSGLHEKVAALMEEVGLAPLHIKKYPHEFSGGQRQRVAIARALALRPTLVIADEPVSALDVSIQSQILNLLTSLTQKYCLTMMFISHDLSVVRHITNRTAVMYFGKIVELGPTEDVFTDPLHPYTKALFSAIPMPDPDREKAKKRVVLKGDPVSSSSFFKGCRFRARCPIASGVCKKEEPRLCQKSGHTETNHLSACHME